MRFEGVLRFLLATTAVAAETMVSVVTATFLLPSLALSHQSLHISDNDNEGKIDNNDLTSTVSPSSSSSAVSSSSHAFLSGLDEHSNIEQTKEESKNNRKYLRLRHDKNSGDKIRKPISDYNNERNNVVRNNDGREVREGGTNKNYYNDEDYENDPSSVLSSKHNKQHDSNNAITNNNKINDNIYGGVDKYHIVSYHNNHHQGNRKLTVVEYGNNNNDDELWLLQEPYTTIQGQSFLNEVGDDPNAVEFSHIFGRSNQVHLRTWDGSWKSNFYLPSPDDVPIGSKIELVCESTWGFNVHYWGKSHNTEIVHLNTNSNLFLIVFEVEIDDNDDNGNSTTRLWLTEQDVDALAPIAIVPETTESEYETCADDPNFRFKGIRRYTCRGFVSKNAPKKCKYTNPITGISVRESCPTYCKRSCPPCEDGKGLIRLDDGSKLRCKDIKRLSLCDVTIESKRPRETTTARKAKSLCPVSCDHPMCKSSETSDLEGDENSKLNTSTDSLSNAPTGAPTSSSGSGSSAPPGTPKGCKKKGTDNNGTSNTDCAKCTLGVAGLYHPCNADPPRCYGLDCENSPNWAGPRYKLLEPPGDGECRKKGFANNGVTDETCAQCIRGLWNVYYPCNEIGRCEGTGCKNSPHWAGDGL